MIDLIYSALLRLLPDNFDGADREEIWETYQTRIERAHAHGTWHATRARLRELIDLAASVVRALWPLPSIDSLRQDVRIGVRALMRAPTVTALSVASLGLGIGATTSLFSALDVWLVRPLPLPEPDRLVAVAMANFENGWNNNAFSVRDYADWSEQTRSLELAVWAPGSMNLQVGDEVQRMSTLSVSANLPRVLGVDIVRGRSFTPEDGRPDAARVALVTSRFARGLFRAAGDAVGETLVLDGVPHTVVGVMTPDRALPTEQAAIWRPLRYSGAEPRAGHSYWGVARLHEGVSVEAAAAELDEIAGRVALDDPQNTFPDAAVQPLRDSIYSSELRSAGTVIAVAALFVLLIACANIANILLARGLTRRHEVAVRGALGAGRGRLVQQLLVESLLIAVVGGALGIGLSFVGLDLLLTYALPPEVPGWDTMSIDGRMLSVAAGLTVASTLVFGLVPALRTTRADLRDRLADGARGTGVGRRGRLASAFVAVEISASLVLLVLTGLMIRVLSEMRSVDLGIELGDAITFRLDVPPASQETGDGLRLFNEALAERLGAERDVRGVAYSSGHVLSGWSTLLYTVPGLTSLDGRPRNSAEYRRVSYDYAQVLDIELIAGRWFDSNVDVPDGAAVAVVSRELARLWWSGPAEAVGQTISPRPGDEVRIVGVVEDTRLRGPDRVPPPTIFEPFAQRPTRYAMWVVRHGSGQDVTAGRIRAVVREMDPSLAVFTMQTGEEVMDDVIAEQRVGLRILAPLGALALSLTLVGVYGVTAHSVGGRMHEMGLRVALGADGGQLLRLVLAGSARTAAVGIGIGLLTSLIAGQGLSWLLAGVSPRDPLVLAGAAVLSMGAITVASIVPARKALGADPVAVMRE